MPSRPRPVRLTRAIEFSASLRHALPELSDEENRRRFGVKAAQHGHNYRLEVTVEGERGVLVESMEGGHEDAELHAAWSEGHVSTSVWNVRGSVTGCEGGGGELGGRSSEGRGESRERRGSGR